MKHETNYLKYYEARSVNIGAIDYEIVSKAAEMINAAERDRDVPREKTQGLLSRLFKKLLGLFGHQTP